METKPTSVGRLPRVRVGLHRSAFVLLSAAIVGISSERMFWYWSSNPVDHWVVTMVYGAPVAATLWVIDRFRINSIASLVLAAPVFAYVVEGVITPVLYSGGPFVPFFPAWFSFWHGFLGIVGLWYLLHRWLIDGRWAVIAWASAAMGVFWGLWSTTMWLPENLNDAELIKDLGGELQLLGPAGFWLYTIEFTAILAAAHWTWGRIRSPAEFTPSKPAMGIYVLGVGAVLVVWTVAIPWALPMFAAYVGLQIWILRRHASTAKGPGLLAQLGGIVRARHLAALAPMPLAASTTYAVIWQLDPPLSWIRAFMFSTIFLQASFAIVVLVRVGYRTFNWGLTPCSSFEGLARPPCARRRQCQRSWLISCCKHKPPPLRPWPDRVTG